MAIEDEVLTLEDFLIGLETDHGFPQGFGHYFDSATACAYGNAAIDIAKRTGQTINVSTIDTIAERLDDSMVDLFGSDSDVDIIYFNDDELLSLPEIAEKVRSHAKRIGMPLTKSMIDMRYLI